MRNNKKHLVYVEFHGKTESKWIEIASGSLIKMQEVADDWQQAGHNVCLIEQTNKIIQIQKIKKEKKENPYERDFEEFWAIYPRQPSSHPKEKALEAYTRIREGGTSREAVLASLRALKQESREEKYNPHAFRWLNNTNFPHVEDHEVVVDYASKAQEIRKRIESGS